MTDGGAKLKRLRSQAMIQSDDQYRERITKAVLYAIMRNSAVDIGDGRQGCEMRTIPICAALTDLVAQLLAAKARDLGETTRKDIRHVGEAYGQALRLKIQQILDSGNVLPSYRGINDGAPPVDPSLN